MRELKIRVPKGHAANLSRLANHAGIESVVAHEVYVYGSAEIQEEVKFKSSTPQARKFLSALFQSSFFNKTTYSFSSHDIRALVTGDGARNVTFPVCVPYSEIEQDFWQYVHITASLVIRTLVSAGLLAYALLRDDMVLGIGAMIFTPFSPLILAVAFGLVARQGALVKQALLAFGTTLLLTVASAAMVTCVAGGPLLFNRFGSLATNIFIAIITGLMAAVADADDVGRRQLLGLAMAYPFVKLPVWLGISLALGVSDHNTTSTRLMALIANPVAMLLSALFAYWVMARHGELKDLPS